MRRWISFLLLSAALLSLSGCGYNALQSSDEQIKASWAEVLNQYQRRADLVPNLVNVVKGYAAHEKDVFVQVTEARAKVGQIQATPEAARLLIFGALQWAVQWYRPQGALSLDQLTEQAMLLFTREK